MAAEWYVLKAKPHKEMALFHQVTAYKIECFYPRIYVEPVNPRSAKIRPYFPGYMFVRIDPDEMGFSMLEWMPFSRGLVRFDNVPGSVPGALIIELRECLRDTNGTNKLKKNRFEPQAKIRIIEGLFEGYEAIFETRIKGEERVRVLLKLLDDRHLPLELQIGQIRLNNR